MSCDCANGCTTCDPSLTVTAADLAGLKQDIATIDDVVESPALTTTTKNGREIDTLTGALTKLGFQPPVTYAGGIAVTETTQTVEEAGVVYAPLPSEVPFTTSGTWGGDDDARFYTVQSVHLYDGDVVIAKPTVADMQGDANLQLGNVVQTEGYLASRDQGAGLYRVVAAGTLPVDGGTVIDLTASGHIALLVSDSTRLNVAQYGAVGDGVTDDTARVQAAIDATALWAGGGELLFPIASGGVFKLNVVIPSNVILVGANRGVKLIPCLNAPVVSLKADEDVSQAGLRNITIDGTATQGGFASQDGIRSAPDIGAVHTGLTLVDVSIVNCGAAGVALHAIEPDSGIEQVGLPQMLRCVVTGCTGPGLSLFGSVHLLEAISCDISDNGDENTDNLSNIVIERSASTAPSQNSLTSCRFEVPSYVAGGYALAALGAVDLAVNRCQFGEFHTAILVDNPPNGVVSVNDCRFERTSGDIIAVAEVVDVNGFIWNGNNVNASTTGPVGLDLAGNASEVRRLEIGSTNSWGGLDSATSGLPTKVIAAATTTVSLPNTSGPIPMNLNADGNANVSTLFDFNGGNEQFVHGDTIVINIRQATRTITIVHGGGNILLAGGANFTLNEVGDRIGLMWDENLDAWVELFRSSLS